MMANVFLFSDGAARRVGRELCFDEEPEGTFHVDRYEGAEIFNDPKETGAYAVAGSHHSRCKVGHDEYIETKGPNFGTGIGVSEKSGVRAFTQAELVSVSVSDGQAKATLALSAKTGVGVGPSGVEAKVLGTGIKCGRTVGFSVLGSGFEF